jgi:hypothetical protein
MPDRAAAPVHEKRAPAAENRLIDRLAAELVRASCLPHNIGVCRPYEEDSRLGHAESHPHSLLGHELLDAEGCPEALAVDIPQPVEYADDVRRSGEDKVTAFPVPA